MKGVFSIIKDPSIMGNIELWYLYVSYRFVSTHPMVQESLSDMMLLKYFDTYLHERLDMLMTFLQVVNSSITISHGDA